MQREETSIDRVALRLRRFQFRLKRSMRQMSQESVNYRIAALAATVAGTEFPALSERQQIMKRKTGKGASVGGLPKGFQQVSTGGDFPPIWIPKAEGDTLHGIVHAKRSIDARKFGREKAKKGEQVMIVTVADADGVLQSVVESHALREFCASVKQGQEVFIRFDGVKKFGKKRLKLFTAGVKK